MEKVLITGASGQLGQALTGLLKEHKEYELYLTGSKESEDGRIEKLDIADESAVNRLISQLRPDIIINAGAMTAVDLCESEQDRAYRVNALAPKYLAIATEKMGGKLIHISTDYVFDGQATLPYTEEAVTNPISIYGKTKLAGEEFVKEYCKRYLILRTAWLYGKGKNFVGTMLGLQVSGKKIRVVADQFGSPTSALELARVIAYLMKTEDYGIYHATCEGSTSWYDFALEIFRQAGRKAKLEPIPSKEYPTPARRPMYSVLENKALHEKHGYYMKDWKEALREYLREEDV